MSELLDKWTQILKNRNYGKIRDYVDDKHKRRLQGYQIIHYYLRGDSAACLLNLADDQRVWWTDPGTLKRFASAFAKLTTKGFRVVPEKEEIEDAIEQWNARAKIYKTIRVAEMHASAFGDAVLIPVWDKKLKLPKLEIYYPNCYIPIDDSNILIVYEDTRDPEIIFVRHYMLGKKAKKTTDGKIILTDERSVGFREFIFSEDDFITATGNVETLEHKVMSMPDEFTPLPFSDFPVIHIPNGYPDLENFGTSDFETSLDMFDTYHQIISDKRKQARFLIPPIGVRANRMPGNQDKFSGKVKVPYEPATMVWLGDQGGFDVPDFSSMLEAANKELIAVRLELMRSCGLTKAAFGELGDVSNLRELEIKLIYGPLDAEIAERRADRMPYWQDILLRVQELWLAEDPNGYKSRFQSTNLADCKIQLDDIIPLDVRQMLSNLNAIGDRLDNETYINEALKITGIAADPEEIAKKLEEESKLANGILT